MSTTAILVGGYWTYLLAIKERKFEPRANIEHKTAHVALNSDINLLRVVVKITNTGDAELVAQDSKVMILRIVPLELRRIGEAEGIDISSELRMQSDGVDVQRPAEAFRWPLVASFCTKREESQAASPPIKNLNHPEHSLGLPYLLGQNIEASEDLLFGIASPELRSFIAHQAEHNYNPNPARSGLSQSFPADRLKTDKPAKPKALTQTNEGDAIEPSAAESLQENCKISKASEALTIRPKEYAELSYEFAVDSRIKVVDVYTYYRNQNSSSLGWELMSIYDFRSRQ